MESPTPSSLPGFSSRVSHEVVVKVSARSALIWRLAWAWRIWFQPGWLIAMTCRLMLAVVRKPQFLAMYISPQCCWSVLRTWQLPYSRASDPRDSQEEVTLSYDLECHTRSWDILTWNHQGKLLSNSWPVDYLHIIQLLTHLPKPRDPRTPLFKGNSRAWLSKWWDS